MAKKPTTLGAKLSARFQDHEKRLRALERKRAKVKREPEPADDLEEDTDDEDADDEGGDDADEEDEEGANDGFGVEW